MEDQGRFDMLVQGGLVVTPRGLVRASVGIRGEQIAAVSAGIDPSTAGQVIDARGKLIFPGIIDSHCHPVYADDIRAYSEQMAAGGVTTLIPMTGRFGAAGKGGVLDAVDAFIQEGNRLSHLDFGIHLTLRQGDEVGSLIPEAARRGIRSFKMFMCFKKPGAMVEDPQLLEAMAAIAENGSVAMVHAENEAIVDYLERTFQERGQVAPQYYPWSRPNIAEAEAVFRALSLAEVAGCPLYLVHLSAHESLEVARWFRGRGRTPIFVETCMYYLLFTEDELRRQGSLVKISPPFRKAEDVDAMWRAIDDGSVDVIATDGSGQTRARKAEGGDNIFKAAFGITGSQFMIPLVYSEGVNRGRVTLPRLAEVWCERPARIFGLYPRKGTIQEGSDADLVILDPERGMRVGVALQRGHSDYCPYEGYEALGTPVLTMQRGRIVLEDGELRARPGQGRFVPATAPLLDRASWVRGD